MQQKDKRRIYSTIIVIMAGLLVVHLLWGGRLAGETGIPWLILASVAIGVVSLISFTAAKYIVAGWNKLAEALGYVNSRILLTLIFFLVLFPLSIISRFFKKDPLHLKKPENTNFQERNHNYRPEDLEKMW